MQIVYLDQNKWIELAKVAHGKVDDPELRQVLDVMVEAKRLKQACFPLSATHYMELQKVGSPELRSRLGEFMHSMSAGQRLTPTWRILRYEVEKTLQRYFPDRVSSTKVQRFALLGYGTAHAFDDSTLEFAHEEICAGLSPEQASLMRALAAAFEDRMQLEMLTGASGITGEAQPGVDFSDLEEPFVDHLRSLNALLEPLTKMQRERALSALALPDVKPILDELLQKHGVPPDVFSARVTWSGFLDSLPTQRVTRHLHDQWAKNADLPSRPSDLYDWGALGPYAMYCDVVVTEKLFCDLIHRNGFQANAKVITDLRRLREVCFEISRS